MPTYPTPALGDYVRRSDLIAILASLGVSTGGAVVGPQGPAGPPGPSGVAGAAGGALAGTYPNPVLAAGAATGVALGTDVLTTTTAAGTYMAKGTMVINVADYGALGDRRMDAAAPATAASGGTDNTAAFNAAIAVLNAVAVKDSSRWHERLTQARPTLFIPAGRWNIGDLNPILVPGVRVVGAGRDATTLFHTGSTAPFTFGTFTTTPTSPYQGLASYASFENLAMVQANEWHGLGLGFGTEGSRTRKAIIDNYGGGMYLYRCRFTGFQYAFQGNGSSDFSQFVDCDFFYCDVGVYLGPITQQFRFQGCQFFGCREGVVLDGVTQGSLRDTFFVDGKETHLSIESNTVSRTGVQWVGADYNTIEIASCWFEDGADVLTNRVVKEHIKFSSATTTPRWVNIHDCYIVAGGTLGTPRAFVRIAKGTRILIERITVSGVLDWMVERLNGAFPLVILADHHTQDGTAVTPKWGDSVSGVLTTGWIGAVYRESWLRRVDVPAGEINFESHSFDDATRLKITHLATPRLEFASWISAAWRPRITFDFNDSSIMFGDSQDVAIRRYGANILGTNSASVFRTGLAVTGSRPSAVTVGAGSMFYDTTLSKPIWSDGTVWRDGAGTSV